MYQVKLPVFEGPFDLLLHLIKKEQLNIYDIPIAKITREYLDYLSMMEALDLDIASEFLVIAALLLSIKSKMLLPKPIIDCEDQEIEEDPKLELTKRLIEYKKYKDLASKLEQRLHFYQNVFTRPYELEKDETELVECNLFELVKALQKILKEKENKMEILLEDISIEERMEYLQRLLETQEEICFFSLFKDTKDKITVIITFLALLELIRLRKICVRQHRLFSEIMIYRV